MREVISKAADDEKNVNADKATSEDTEAGIAEDNRQHGDCVQAIDFATVFQVHRAAVLGGATDAGSDPVCGARTGGI